MEGGQNGLRRSDKSAAGLCLTQALRARTACTPRTLIVAARLQQDECRHETQNRLITAD